MVGEGEMMPDLFSDPLYLRSSYWSLSTSAIWSKHFPSYGWGEVSGSVVVFGIQLMYLFLQGGARWLRCGVYDGI